MVWWMLIVQMTWNDPYANITVNNISSRLQSRIWDSKHIILCLIIHDRRHVVSTPTRGSHTQMTIRLNSTVSNILGKRQAYICWYVLVCPHTHYKYLLSCLFQPVLVKTVAVSCIILTNNNSGISSYTNLSSMRRDINQLGSEPHK